MKLRAIVIMLCVAFALAANAQDSSCLIISEVVTGAASGACPKWIEITNTGLANFTFSEGGVIVQMNKETDVDIDVDFTAVTILAGQSYVLNSRDGGACTGAFFSVYGFEPDMETYADFGDGNDRYILTDTNDSSNLVDIYGEFGTDGVGEVWEYTAGYAYRLAAYNAGNGGVFVPGEWFFGGVGSLDGPNPEELLQTLTTPTVHVYDEDCRACLEKADSNCDSAVNAFDIDPFVVALTGGQAAWEAAYTCDYLCANDCNDDGSVNAFDIDPFVAILTRR